MRQTQQSVIELRPSVPETYKKQLLGVSAKQHFGNRS
jgi:hypothetical protein